MRPGDDDGFWAPRSAPPAQPAPDEAPTELHAPRTEQHAAPPEFGEAPTELREPVPDGGRRRAAVLGSVAGIVVAAAIVAGIVLVVTGRGDPSGGASQVGAERTASPAKTPTPTTPSATPAPTPSAAATPGAVPAYRPATGSRISERGVTYLLPGSAWTVSGEQQLATGLYVRTLSGPGGASIDVYLSPASPAAPPDRYVIARAGVTTPSGYAIERAVLRAYPTPGCRARTCDDYLVSDQLFGGVAVLANDTGRTASAAALSVAASVGPSAGEPPSEAEDEPSAAPSGKTKKAKPGKGEGNGRDRQRGNGPPGRGPG